MTQYTIPAEGLVAKPAHELAAMIQAGEVTSREVTQAFLDRIAEIDDELGAFLHVGAEEALAAADKVDEQVKNGEEPAAALAGVPLALKDHGLFHGERRVQADEEPARSGARPGWFRRWHRCSACVW